MVLSAYEGECGEECFSKISVQSINHGRQANAFIMAVTVVQLHESNPAAQSLCAHSFIKGENNLLLFPTRIKALTCCLICSAALGQLFVQKFDAAELAFRESCSVVLQRFIQF